MKPKNRQKLLASTLLIGAAAWTSPTFAQESAPVDSTPEKTAEGEAAPPASETTTAEGQPVSETSPTESGGAIVVTGSRIRRDNFSTPQNVDVLTRDDQVLAGSRSTAETLQTATVTSGTSQLSGSFLGFQSEGGQAAANVGLRGLGSARTLVLLNGRRLAPAGAGNQLVSADLNVLPTGIVQRIEILREGASSIYGSDAIAGVINIITDTKLDGLTIDAFADVPVQYGSGGRTYRIGATAGHTFDRGYVMAAIEYKKDDGLRAGDNPDWRCPRELAYINGVEVGQGSPDDPNKLRCFPFSHASIGTARGYGFGLTTIRVPDDKPFAGPPDADTDPEFFTYFPGRFTFTDGDANNGPLNVNDFNLRPLAANSTFDSHVFSPVKTITGFLNGAYEIGALGDAELYGEVLFSKRKSHQDASTQISPTGLTNYGEAQLYGGNIFGYYGIPDLPCADVYGSACSPFFPTAWGVRGTNGYNAGVTYFRPFIQPDRVFRSFQKVEFWRANGGLRGNLGVGDWRYDANFMISRTDATDGITWPTQEHMNNIWVAVAAPDGTPSQFTVTAQPGAEQPGTYTCAANVTDGAYNGGTCVPINMFDPNVFFGGHLSDAFYDYLYENHVGTTDYNQETFNLVLDGSLPFSLQGGAPKMAIGFEHRRDKIHDEPAPQRQVNGLYGYSSALPTIGSDRVNELFAELQLPLLKDRPGVDLLELDGSVRYTRYRSYGSDVTYHVNAQYAPVSFIRFRGNYGTNFRAPNLYEQFVADQVGFYPGEFDPCDAFASSNSPGSNVYENCLAELTPLLDDPSTPDVNEALQYVTTGGGIQVTTQGGADILDAEKAKTWGVGVVFTAPRHVADFSLAIDYWHVKVKDEVALLGQNILNFCYGTNPADFETSPYCQLIGTPQPDGSRLRRQPGVLLGGGGELTEFFNPYLNIAQQIASGIDFDARYATRLFGGKFSTQLQATRNIDQKQESFAGQGLTEYNGTLGYPGQGAGPKWVASLDTRFTTANDITFRWGVEFVGRTDAYKFVNDVFFQPNGDPCPDDPAPGECVLWDYDLTAERYWEHGVSVQWLWRNVGQFTVGVNNLFNAKPPTISLHPDSGGQYPRLGNFFANGPYDYRGRSVFVNVTKTFN